MEVASLARQRELEVRGQLLELVVAWGGFEVRRQLLGSVGAWGRKVILTAAVAVQGVLGEVRIVSPGKKRV